jgi:hypothetical protein
LHLSGRAFNIQSSGGGYGVIINNTTASTSAPFTIQKQGANRITFTDAGAGTFVSTISAAGATLTGALSGTSASFSGSLGIGGISSPDIIGYGTSGILGILGASGNPASIQLGIVGTAGATTTALGDLNVFGLNGGSTVVARTIIRSSLDGATNSTKMDFFTMNGGSASSKFTLASTGAATFSSSVTASTTLSARIGFSSAGTNASPFFDEAIILGQGTNQSKIQYGNSFGSSAGTWMKFVVNSNTASNTPVDVMTLKYDGNVGIGTTAPANPISFIRLLNISGGDAALVLSNSNGTAKNWSIGALDSGSLGIYDGSNPRMTITSGGDVVIGKTSQSFPTVGHALLPNGQVSHVTDGNAVLFLNRLSTDGDIAIFYRSSSAVGSISVTTSLTSYNITSDYRLKQDFKSVNGLDLVNKINVYNYQWKSDNTRMDGVLAHELQEVLPYAVTGVKDGERMQSVDYSKIVPVMLQAIKELKAELDTLKNK